MFDGVDFCISLDEGRGPLDGPHIGHGRINERLVREIDAAEFETMTRRGRMDGEVDGFPRVEGGSIDFCGCGERALFVHEKLVEMTDRQAV